MNLMRRTIIILSIICVVTIGTATPILAVTNHNLKWGVKVGNQFHYTYSGNLTRECHNFYDFYVKIESLPTIPIDVVSFHDTEFTLEHCSYYFENGTEMSSFMPWRTIAIGNWTLVQERVSVQLPDDCVWINTETEWGFSYTVNASEWTPGTVYFPVDIVHTTKFSKTDGVMILYHILEIHEGGPIESGQITRTEVQSIPYIGIGVGVTAFIVIVAVVMKRR